MSHVVQTSVEAVQRQGYSIMEHVLSNSECSDLHDQMVGPAVQRSRAGARHLLCSKVVASLAADERLIAIGSAVLHRPAVPFRATLFDKSHDANWSVLWHQDTALPLRVRFDAPGWGPWSSKAGVLYAHAPAEALERVVALRIHLDDSVATNGPLRVIPGTHTRGVLSDDEVEQIARSAHVADCVVSRGGVVVMRPLLIHSSPRVEVAAPRRVLHIEYADSLLLAPGVELATA